jgi:predicted HTH transcriptional regulator
MNMNFRENETLELKKSTSELKAAIISIASILNKHGFGDLYFGIKNDGKIVGQEISEKTLRDISQSKSNEAAIFKDRVEIYNPGDFPEGLTPQDFIKGRERSVLRNPLISQTLYYSKDVERWGSGLKRIYEDCIENDVKVEFKILKTGFLVVFYRKDDESFSARKEEVCEGIKKDVNEGINEGINEGVNEEVNR